jgi:hypothetical protein
VGATGGRVDALAVVSIAAVVCLLEPVVHEVIGHGSAAVLLGAHLQQVSSVYMLADEHNLPVSSVRIIAAAGIVSNLTFGVLALRLFDSLRGAGANVRYFLWLFGNSNMFVGSGYMLALSFADFGDIQELVAGSPHQFAAQLLLTFLGACIALATYVSAARSLEEFLGTVARMQRALMLTVVPYATIGVLNTAAGALNPQGAMLILSSAAAASFGGHMPMAWLSFAVRKPRAALSEHPATPTRLPAWIAAAVVAVVVLVAVLAPGLPR